MDSVFHSSAASFVPKRSLQVKDPGSAGTHFIGMVLSIAAFFPLMHRTLMHPEMSRIISILVFVLSMTALYAASTTYHTFDKTPKINRFLKKMDHCMIFVMIAGSYTPICVVVLHNFIGYGMLALVWTIAALGIVFKLCWVTCPKWVSSVLYILMGWVCLLAFPEIISTLSTPAFLWLLIGGIFYTIGGVIYALKLPLFNARHKNFGTHEIFHVFVMIGSLCHFIMMYLYVA